MKRVFIIHGWEGFPEEGWFPWLKQELEAKGFAVQVPAMPDTETPVIEAWVAKLKEVVGTPDEHTYFVGHSIGCQAIMRYLQTINAKIGGVLFVGGWVNLLPASFEEEGAEAIARPWLDTPLDWDKLKQHTFIAIFSDNDPFVPVADAKLFEEKLGATTIKVEKKGHFSGRDGIKKLSVVLDELLNMAG